VKRNLKPKKFITIKDIEESLRAKGKIHKRTVCSNCGGNIFNICIIGCEYFSEMCVKCGRTNRIFRKTPNLQQKTRFLNYIDLHKKFWVIQNTLMIQ